MAVPLNNITILRTGRQTEWIKCFVEEFESKLLEYQNESEGKMEKTHSLTKHLQSISNVPISAAATVATGKMVSTKIEFIGKCIQFFDNHKEKTIVKTAKFNSLSHGKNLRLALIEVAFFIFQHYQQPFVEYPEEKWLKYKRKYAKDATQRIFDSTTNKKVDENEFKVFSDFLFGCFARGRSTWCENQPGQPIPIASKCLDKMKNVYSSSKTFNELNGHCGIVIKTNNLEYYYQNENLPKKGFILQLEGGDILKGMKPIKIKKNMYKHVFASDAEREEIVEELFKRINDHDEKLVKSRLINIETMMNWLGGDIKEVKQDLNVIEEVVIESSKDVKDLKKTVVESKQEILREMKDLNLKQREEEFKFPFHLKAPVKNFTGRENEADEIHEMFEEIKSRGANIQRAVCVSGMGGIGKTELCRYYAKKYQEHYKNRIVWIEAEKLESDLQDLAEKLKIPIEKYKKNEGREVDLSMLCEDVLSKFSLSALFIVNNIEDYDQVKIFLLKDVKQSERHSLLFSSRRKEWNVGQHGKINVVHLNGFSEGESFLANIFTDHEISFTKEEVKELNETLQSLPLALQQSACYIINLNKSLRKRGGNVYTINRYIEEFKELEKKKLLAYHFEEKSLEERSYLETVYTTWAFTFKRIESKETNGKQAIQILHMITYLPPDLIDFKKLHSGIVNNNQGDELINSIKDVETFWSAVEILDVFSIINLHEGSGSIHRLIQEVTRIHLRESNEELANLKILFNTFPNDSQYKNKIIRAHIWYFAQSHVELLSMYPLHEEKCLSYIPRTTLEAILKHLKPLNEKLLRALLSLEYVQQQILWINKGEFVKSLFEYDIKIYYTPNFYRGLLKNTAIFDFVLDNYVRKSSSMKNNQLILYLLMATSRSNQLRQFLLYFDWNERQELFRTKYFDDTGFAAFAFEHFNPENLKVLIQHGFNIIADIYQYRGYFSAALSLEDLVLWKMRLIDIYVQLEYDLFFIDDKTESLIQYILLGSTLQEVQHLIEKGINLRTEVDNLGRNALMFVSQCENASLDLVKYLIEEVQIDLNAKDQFDRSLIHYAARGRNIEILTYLREEQKIDLTATDRFGCNIFHYFFSLCDVNMLTLQNCKAKYFAQYCPKEILQHHFCISGNNYWHGSDFFETDILRNEFQECARKNNDNHQNSLFVAVANDNQRVLEVCDELNVNYDINGVDNLNRSLLHYALFKHQQLELDGFFNDIKEFNLNIQTFRYQYSSDIVGILMERKIDVTLNDIFGINALHLAAGVSPLREFEELLHIYGEGEIDVKDSNKCQPLHYSAFSGNYKTMKCLLEKGADVNATNKNLQTPLHLLFLNVHLPRYTIDCLDLLLVKYGADATVKDLNDQLAFDYFRFKCKDKEYFSEIFYKTVPYDGIDRIAKETDVVINEIESFFKQKDI